MTEHALNFPRTLCTNSTIHSLRGMTLLLQALDGIIWKLYLLSTQWDRCDLMTLLNELFMGFYVWNSSEVLRYQHNKSWWLEREKRVCFQTWLVWVTKWFARKRRLQPSCQTWPRGQEPNPGHVEKLTHVPRVTPSHRHQTDNDTDNETDNDALKQFHLRWRNNYVSICFVSIA